MYLRLSGNHIHDKPLRSGQAQEPRFVIEVTENVPNEHVHITKCDQIIETGGLFVGFTSVEIQMYLF